MLLSKPSRPRIPCEVVWWVGWAGSGDIFGWVGILGVVAKGIRYREREYLL